MVEAMQAAASPLARKLKLKPGARAAVIGARPDYLARLDLPPDVGVSNSLDGTFDWIQVFVRTSADLAAIVEPLVAALAPTGIAWISYPKGSSKIQTDLTRELTGGTERIQLEFGRPVGEVPLRIVGGARTIRIERPAGVPIRIGIQGGSSSVGLDGQVLGKKGGQVSIESRGWTTAADRFSLEVVGGSKSIEVIQRPA